MNFVLMSDFSSKMSLWQCGAVFRFRPEFLIVFGLIIKAALSCSHHKSGYVGGMGCTCSKASQPSGPTLLDHGRRSASSHAKPTRKSLESWELQLLKVSSELKMKLKDPYFVAKRCDLDSSGDLDMHELKQAAGAFGLKFSPEKLQQLMAGEARINKERFAEIVADAPTSAEGRRTRPTIPHSLRGMALGQLQQLESMFITSGWLDAKCNAFNLEHAEAISEGKKFVQAANLYAMDSFVVTPMSRPGSCDARDQDSANVVPLANEEMSFSELVNPSGLIVHCFVSHFWGHLFSQTVTALRRWAEMNTQRMSTESPKSVVFWICLFALNQHAVADEVGENPMQGPFNAALAQAEDGAVMVLDEQINPFKRIWCLFEVSRLKELKQPFELICELGSLSKPESLADEQADPAAVEDLLRATCEALWEVSAVKAKASVKEDQVRIWEEIANPGYRKFLKGLRSQIMADRSDVSCGWFTEFDQHSQAMLSSALLHFYLMHNRYLEAAKCCEHGAWFTEEQLAEMKEHIAEGDRTSWLTNLLNINAGNNCLNIVGLLLRSGVCMQAADDALLPAAFGGHEAVTKLLLDNGADVAAAKNKGATALMLAAVGGYEAVVNLLLDHGADVAAADNNGYTALMNAARAGHEAVAKVLLDHGGDVAAANKNADTALMQAAGAGHEAVAKVLLDHGADVAAANNNGVTALIFAARAGHEAVAKVLLDHGADVAAANNNGVTALIFAAEAGHEAVAKVLLDHHADVAAADNSGYTALIRAAQGGHEAVTKVLLDSGADMAAADNDGDTALIHATFGGHEAVVKLLLDHGADVAAAKNNGATALIFAAGAGHEAVAKVLLDSGADVGAAHNDGFTALMVAAKGGHEAVTKLLLDHAADVAAAKNNGATALILAAGAGHEAVAKVLLDHGADVAAANNIGDAALILAAGAGHEAVAKVLLDHGADVAAANNNGDPALMHAAFGGHEAVVNLLLDHGADVAAADNNGATALILAAGAGHEAVAKVLLDNGGDVAAANKNGDTALMFAAGHGHEAVAKVLLDHGGDVAAANNNGATALILAAGAGHEAVTKVLLEHHADVAAADNNGYTALMQAAGAGHEAVAKVLLDHHADVAAADNDGPTALILAAQGGHQAVVELLLSQMLLDHGAEWRIELPQ